MTTNYTIKTLPDLEQVAPGRSGCDGCGAVMAARWISKITGQSTIMVNATGCMCVNYGYAGAPLHPYIHSLFENTGSILSGIDAGLRALGRRQEVNLVGLAGDGGTVDIGFQSLSGAVERQHRFLYVCYDNEGYMNTGGQRSGATPYGSNTATTPVGSEQQGEGLSLLRRKNMVLVMAAHGIPYAATASIAYPLDFMNKVKKAIEIDGPTYLHVLAPCPTSWGFASEESVKIGKLAVETRFAPLYEVEQGSKIKLDRRRSKGTPITEYLKAQKRFSHLLKLENQHRVDEIQSQIDESWRYLESLAQE